MHVNRAIAPNCLIYGIIIIIMSSLLLSVAPLKHCSVEILCTHANQIIKVKVL